MVACWSECTLKIKLKPVFTKSKLVYCYCLKGLFIFCGQIDDVMHYMGEKNGKLSHVCSAQNYPPATPLPERSCAMLGDSEASESGLRGPTPP